jgi:hypothetical protein
MALFIGLLVQWLPFPFIFPTGGRLARVQHAVPASVAETKQHIHETIGHVSLERPLGPSASLTLSLNLQALMFIPWGVYTWNLAWFLAIGVLYYVVTAIENDSLVGATTGVPLLLIEAYRNLRPYSF